MMQDLTDKDWQVSRDGLFMPKVLEFINVLKIGLNDFTVSAFIEKPIDFEVQILHALIGSFESFLDPI